MTFQDTATAPSGHPVRRSRRRWMVPAVFLLGISAVLGHALVSGAEEPGVPLGAVAAVPGGLLRVNGILSCETGASQSPACSPGHGQPVPEDAHRIEVLLEFTALDAEGLEFDAGDYAVDRLGGGESPVLWSSSAEESVGQGGTLRTALVFEVPDQAVELTLEGAGGTRLLLGSDHHSGGGST